MMDENSKKWAFWALSCAFLVDFGLRLHSANFTFLEGSVWIIEH